MKDAAMATVLIDQVSPSLAATWLNKEDMYDQTARGLVHDQVL